MKIAASMSVGRLAPKHSLNIDNIRAISKNVTPKLIKNDVVTTRISHSFLPFPGRKLWDSFIQHLPSIPHQTKSTGTEAERKELMKAFIERIDLYPEKRKDGCWIRRIVFNFLMPVEGGEVKELSLESETTVETVVLLSRVHTTK